MLVRRMTVGAACLAGLLLASMAGCGSGGSTQTPNTPAGSSASPQSSTSPAETAGADTQQTAAESAASSAAADVLAEEGWGNLSGRIVYDGAAPPQKQLPVNRDQDVCTRQHPLDETLVVNSENGGVANVVVHLYLSRNDDPPEVHPSYDQTNDVEVVLDNEFCRFEPHITLLRTTQTLVIGNKDATGHNTNVSTLRENLPFNETVPTGGPGIRKTLSEREARPAMVTCNIHTWMKGWLIVQDHPYMAVTDQDGKFEIKNLPAGKWTFQFWHEAAGYVDEVTVGGKATEWSRGRPELAVKPGDNDLGEIKVKPELFAN